MGESVAGARALQRYGGIGLDSADAGLSRSAVTWLGAYVLVAITNIVAETAQVFWLALVTLVLALPALALLLLFARGRDRLTGWVLGALFFGWLGDWLGDLLVPHIAWKMVFFFLGHLCYLAAFWPYRSRSVLTRPGLLACYVLGVTALLAWVVPAAGWPVGAALVAYGLALGTVAVLATGLGPVATVGGVVFIVSDMSIAVTAFVFGGHVPQAELLIMSTYLVAQLLIVLGVVAAPSIPRSIPAPRSARAVARH